MDIQEIESKFEDLLLANPDFDESLLEKNEDGCYEDSDINSMYQMFEAGTEVGEKWQAAKAQAVPEGFVSVENKLPIDGQDVIAFDAIKHCVFKGGEFLQGYIESDTGHEYEEPVEVTHWMAVEAQEPAND